ncbi:MAG: ATP-binding cassette domain-containing protein [Clostridiales Family XIII bacterium]|jgi:peptide/nickel transport system ATP-binding protein|nr:ATP-binding cassette domain-containing protein [Clostridiales Family XIII bacterium]
MSEMLLEVRGLKKYFRTPGGMLHAVDDVSFTIEAGKTLGIVGESGCGKSTLGRTVLGMLDATEGEIYFEGRDITQLRGHGKKALHRDMQIIFQDPYSSLNPRQCVFDLIAVPLKVYRECHGKDALHRRVTGLMETVGLAKRLAYAYPHELDGGRRQRVGIARALALNPKFIVCDEPVSALDVSIQAQVLNLLQDLQDEKGLTYIFVTHDLSVVRHISDDILVMYLGIAVEKSNTKELFKKPLHPYTKGILAAIPVPDIDVKRERVLLCGELTSPIEPKPGCRFANRCPHSEQACRLEEPVMEELLPGHFVACRRARDLNGI